MARSDGSESDLLGSVTVRDVVGKHRRESTWIDTDKPTEARQTMGAFREGEVADPSIGVSIVSYR